MNRGPLPAVVVVGGEEERVIALGGDHGKQPLGLFLGKEGHCGKLNRIKEGCMPRFYDPCHICGRGGCAVSLSLFLLTLFFMAPSFATDQPVPEHGTADGERALSPPRSE